VHVRTKIAVLNLQWKKLMPQFWASIAPPRIVVPARSVVTPLIMIMIIKLEHHTLVVFPQKQFKETKQIKQAKPHWFNKI